MIKKIALMLFASYLMSSCTQDTEYLVTIKTNYGIMKAVLYDGTPKHKENFIKLAENGFYDSLLFHRTIFEFMIQGGDPKSKTAPKDQQLGDGGPGYTTEAEFNKNYTHIKGALAAARQADQINPQKASSGSQFYIVQGRKWTLEEIIQYENNIRNRNKNYALIRVLDLPQCADVRQEVIVKQTEGDGQWLQSFYENADTLIQKYNSDYEPFSYTEEQRNAYVNVGGAPHLDGDYTVFGQVISGLEIIDIIAQQPTDAMDRPVEDIRMFITVEKTSKEKIEKEYGYTFPKAE